MKRRWYECRIPCIVRETKNKWKWEISILLFVIIVHHIHCLCKCELGKSQKTRHYVIQLCFNLDDKRLITKMVIVPLITHTYALSRAVCINSGPKKNKKNRWFCKQRILVRDEAPIQAMYVFNTETPPYDLRAYSLWKTLSHPCYIQLLQKF